MTGEDLKAWRKDVRLSQHDVASIVGKSVPMVSRYEAGITEIPEDVSKTIDDIKAGLADGTIPFTQLGR